MGAPGLGAGCQGASCFPRPVPLSAGRALAHLVPTSAGDAWGCTGVPIYITEDRTFVGSLTSGPPAQRAQSLGTSRLSRAGHKS